VPQERAVPLPDGVPLEIGACLGVPAMTAHYAVFADGPVTGSRVLVAGGAGAVGSYAVQFAAAGGARVAATASGPAKAEICAALGAGLVVDYRDAGAADRLLAWTDGAGFDRIVEVDLGANLPLDLAIAAPNAVIASYSSTSRPEFPFPYYALARKGLTLRIVQGFILPGAARRHAAQEITRHLAAGTLQHRIAEIFPLDEIARAHALAEHGSPVGKVLIRL